MRPGRELPKTLSRRFSRPQRVCAASARPCVLKHGSVHEAIGWSTDLPWHCIVMLEFTRRLKVVLAGLPMPHVYHLVKNFCTRGRRCRATGAERSPESSTTEAHWSDRNSLQTGFP